MRTSGFHEAHAPLGEYPDNDMAQNRNILEQGASVVSGVARGLGMSKSAFIQSASVIIYKKGKDSPELIEAELGTEEIEKTYVNPNHLALDEPVLDTIVFFGPFLF